MRYAKEIRELEADRPDRPDPAAQEAWEVWACQFARLVEHNGNAMPGVFLQVRLADEGKWALFAAASTSKARIETAAPGRTIPAIEVEYEEWIPLRSTVKEAAEVLRDLQNRVVRDVNLIEKAIIRDRLEG